MEKHVGQKIYLHYETPRALIRVTEHVLSLNKNNAFSFKI